MSKVSLNPFAVPPEPVEIPAHMISADVSAFRCKWHGCAAEIWILGTPLCQHHSYAFFDTLALNAPPGYLKQRLDDGTSVAVEQQRETAVKKNGGQPGHVYYLQVGDRIKIGYTVNVAQRMRAYPPTSKLLATQPGSKDLEREMHRKFDAYRTEGREWFQPHAELLAHAEEVRAKYPRQKGHSFRKAHNSAVTVRTAQQWSTIG